MYDECRLKNRGDEMDKITLIKEVRTIAKCGLREAKDTVDEYLVEDTTKEELLTQARKKALDRPPRSQEYRKFIARTIKEMGQKITLVEELLVEDEYEDLVAARYTLDEIPELLEKLKRVTYKLEEVISEEEK